MSKEVLQQVTTEELQRELKRRLTEEATAARRNLNEQQRKQAAILTQEIIDAFAPEHGRTSCSDKNISNGWGSNGHGNLPRCHRCALLQTMRENGFSENFVLCISIAKIELPEVPK